MRHQKSGRRLGRNSAHRKAMYRNMTASLFRHETIKTTLPKAKELRRVVEPLITLAKTDGPSRRRLAFEAALCGARAGLRRRARGVSLRTFRFMGAQWDRRAEAGILMRESSQLWLVRKGT